MPPAPPQRGSYHAITAIFGRREANPCRAAAQLIAVPVPRRPPSRADPLMILRRTVLAATAIALLQAGAFAQSGKVYRVGLVSVGAPDAGVLSADMARNFARRGYVVDRNVVFEGRAAQGEPDRLPRLIDELVAKHVDVIITQGYTAAIAAKERAGNTPVVVTLSGDPVATGLAASLSHPGGN